MGAGVIRVLIIDRQGKEYVTQYEDDLQAQAAALIAKANGCEVKIFGNNK